MRKVRAVKESRIDLDLVQRNDLHLRFSMASRYDFEYPVRCVQQAMDFLLLLIRFNKGGSCKLILNDTTEWTDEAGMGLTGHFKAKYKEETYSDIKEFLE